jgi:glutamate racemase
MGTKKIGVFDSGYGGLTILKDIRKLLPQYEYIYLGDNARAPYGSRSFEVVYQFTLQAVRKLFELDCDLVILACNTASAKALRTIQQWDLPKIDADKRVLGVIRPTAEQIGKFTSTQVVGILGTSGTVNSMSYKIEIHKHYPKIHTVQKACPLWVPLIENNKHFSKGGQLIIQEDFDELMSMHPGIDTVLLACTHYPILREFLDHLSQGRAQIIAQGEIVARSLKDYLLRHHKLERNLSKKNTVHFLTTESPDEFNSFAQRFTGEKISAAQVKIDI